MCAEIKISCKIQCVGGLDIFFSLKAKEKLKIIWNLSLLKLVLP